MGRIFGHIDWIDFILLTSIGLVGLFLLLTISQSLFTQQLMFMIMALLLGGVVSRVDARLLSWFAPYGYVLTLVLLAVSYMGPTIRGATRWINVAGAQLQPSELVKPLLLLSLAWAMQRFPPRSVKGFLIQCGLFILPFLMVFRQPDLGTSTVYVLTWLSMMVAAGFPIRYLIGTIFAGFFLLPFAWQGLHDYQQARITTFLNPGVDPKGTGYNAIQAMIAVGSGQLFGRGLGRGTQSHLRFLPEYHTDFMFATLVEELGFFGGTVLLAGYGFLLWRIVRPLMSGSITSFVPYVYSIGTFSMLLSQVVINAGMNMGIIPITGITLPFVSYGGSSLLSVAVSLGILWSLRHGEQDGSRAVAIGL
ncbi:rod shape-determining protein RodA [Candidatus Gottesmanbacteria bacterium]|nr:rod shape-determining protein RodA [Candidatus Gottesmanbacteria bacterium]